MSSGRFLYGAPAANLDLEGDVTVAVAKERAGFAGYQFGLDDEEVEAVQQTLEDLPTTDAAGKASFTVKLDKLPSSTHPLEAQITVRMAEPGGRAVEHKITVPVTAAGNMIGVKPLFSGRSLADGANATFDVVAVAPDGAAVPQRGLHYELLRIDTHYQFYKRDGSWNYEPVKTTKRVADGTIDTSLDKAGRISLPVNFGRYRLEVSTADANGPVTSVEFDAGFYVDANADTPDMLEVALDKAEYAPGDTMTVAVTARSAGRLTLNVIGDRLLASQTRDVQPGVAQVKLPVGRDWGAGAYLVATLRRPLDAPAAAHAGPRHRRAMVLDRSRGEDAQRRTETAGAAAAELGLAYSGQGFRACRRRRGADRGRRGRRRHSQSDQLQAAVARRLLSRPAGAFGGHPRSLRPVDRRHAGCARANSLRRRRRAPAAGKPADRTAGGVLFRHRDRRRRRQRRGRVRCRRFRRHDPRHGGGLEQG